MLGRKDCILAFKYYLEPLHNMPSSKIVRERTSYLLSDHCILCSSLDELDDYFNLLMLLKLLKKDNVLMNAATVVLRDIIGYISHLQQIKDFRCCQYNLYVFPYSEVFNVGLKFGLLQYSLKNGNHVLKLQCVTFQEINARKCIPIVGHFMRGYIKRAISIVPQVKWRICGSPSLNVTWYISFPQWKEDQASGLRNNILKEKWNCFYDPCDWCQRKVASPNYLDYLLRVTSGIATSMKPRSNKKHNCDIDDTVFMKFTDRESKGFNVPLLTMILFLFSFLLLFLCFCAFKFIFPTLRFLY